MFVLAIDPGRQKCGMAIGHHGIIDRRGIVLTASLPEIIDTWVKEYPPGLVLLGDRTSARELYSLLKARLSGVQIALVAEEGTTLAARQRYFQEHPPRGWRRLLPPSMQRPPEPYDDYVAVLLLERYWTGLGRTFSPQNLPKTSQRREESGRL